jgi:2-polyprenyl-3-methyl-5-hydroxy-6-metoxy-1,4-benzoquinol methylase
MTTAAWDEIADWYDSMRSGGWGPIQTEQSPLDLIGNVSGESVCDLACGQGVMARLLTERGAKATGVDISEKLLEIARLYGSESPLGATYIQDNTPQSE